MIEKSEHVCLFIMAIDVPLCVKHHGMAGWTFSSIFVVVFISLSSALCVELKKLADVYWLMFIGCYK